MVTSVWPALYVHFVEQETCGGRTFLILMVQETSPEKMCEWY